MSQAGATQRYAAAQFGIKQSVVQRIWQRFLDTGGVLKNEQKSGRQRKTSTVDDRYIVTMFRRQRLDTARTLNQQLLMQLVSLFVNRQSEIIFMATEFMLGDQP